MPPSRLVCTSSAGEWAWPTKPANRTDCEPGGVVRNHSAFFNDQQVHLDRWCKRAVPRTGCVTVDEDTNVTVRGNAVTHFQTTRWSLVNHAAGESSPLGRVALSELLRIYMPAMQAHLVRRKRLSAEFAEELLQGFVIKNILEGELLQRADQSAGRFRSWLLKWLENYVRHETSRKRRDVEVVEIENQVDNKSDADIFEVEWARSTLQEAMRLMKQECLSEGHLNRWKIFEQRLLNPLLAGTEPQEYEQLVSELSLQNVAQAQNMLVTAKRQFQRILEWVVASYSNAPDSVADEIRHLRQILSSAAMADSLLNESPADDSPARERDSIFQAAPRQVAGLLKLDFADHWQRCLEAPLADFLGVDPAPATLKLSLGSLLSHPQPPLETLQALKNYASSQGQQNALDRNREFHLAIYFAAIAAAKLRHGQEISSSRPAELISGCEWLVSQDWLDEETRQLVAEFLRETGPHDRV